MNAKLSHLIKRISIALIPFSLIIILLSIQLITGTTNDPSDVCEDQVISCDESPPDNSDFDDIERH